MKWNRFEFAGAAMLSLGVLLAAPGGLAQMHGGSSMGSSGGMNQSQNGMGQPGNGTKQAGMGTQQNSAGQAQFVANMRRNITVEDDLSKMALKNSSNDDVKKLAHQVLSENRSNEMEMTSATMSAGPSAPTFGPSVPKQTRQAEKKMKKMSGTQFDMLYLEQMDGYVKNDQQVAEEASQNDSSGDMGSLTMKLRNTADQRAKQLAQVAQSENFKIQ